MAGDAPVRGRAGHSAAVFSEQCTIIFGGLTRTLLQDGARRFWKLECCNDTYQLDCSQIDTKQTVIWSQVTTSGTTPCARWCHSCERIASQMYIFGGWRYNVDLDTYDEDKNTFLNDFFIYNRDLMVWSEVVTTGIPPLPRCQTPCCIVDSISHIVSTKTAIQSIAPHFAGGKLDSSSNNSDSNNSAGYFIIFGGAYHNEAFVGDGGEDIDVEYGSKVIDACDFHILDLCTFAWLPIDLSLPVLRGGVNGSVLIQRDSDDRGEGEEREATMTRNGPGKEEWCGDWLWVLSGGMHSDEGAQMPHFKKDVVCIQMR